MKQVGQVVFNSIVRRREAKLCKVALGSGSWSNNNGHLRGMLSAQMAFVAMAFNTQLCKVEAAEVHDLGPRCDKVIDEFLLAVA